LKYTTQKLISNLQLIEIYLKNFTKIYDKDTTDSLISDHKSRKNLLKIFSIRICCLGLYISQHDSCESSLSSDYYSCKLFDELDLIVKTITVANSKILTTITKESVKEFQMMNRRNRIFKLGNQIETMFNNSKYFEIIDELEEHVENNKIPLDNDKCLNLDIYLYLCQSYIQLKQVDKCFYFCKKFMKQIISFLNDELTLNNEELDTKTIQTTTITNNNKRDKRSKTSKNNTTTSTNTEFTISTRKVERIKRLFPFINQLLNYFQKYQNNDSRDETVWMMYQLIIIFFDNTDIAFKFEQFKPLKAFLIIFDSIKMNQQLNSNEKSSLINYIHQVHEYLAK
jgi:hypothetical protein